jgi:hypothetical protein
MLGFVLNTVYSGNAQLNSPKDCSILKKHKLQYLSINDTSAYILLAEDSAIEYHNHGKYQIVSKLNWTNDCEYDMILSSVTIPNFAYRPGDVMHVAMEKIEGDIVYYISTINGNSWEGKLKIVQ